jgi:hypothetical protein
MKTVLGLNHCFKTFCFKASRVKRLRNNVKPVEVNKSEADRNMHLMVQKSVLRIKMQTNGYKLRKTEQEIDTRTEVIEGNERVRIRKAVMLW